MTRRKPLEMLGTTHIPLEAEREFIRYCLWEQARPACVEIVTHTPLAEQAPTLAHIRDLRALLIHTQRIAGQARRTPMDMLPLAALQGMAAEVGGIVRAAQPDGDPTAVDAEAVSFHAARLVGWASWANNDFRTGVFKAQAEARAYGRQAQKLLRLMGVPGV